MQPKWGEVKNEEKAGGVCFSCECFVEPTASGCADSVVLLSSDSPTGLLSGEITAHCQARPRLHGYGPSAVINLHYLQYR